jgi:hypothetical protein
MEEGAVEEEGAVVAKGEDRETRRVLPLPGRKGLTHLEPSSVDPVEAWVAVPVEAVEAGEVSERMMRTADW